MVLIFGKRSDVFIYKMVDWLTYFNCDYRIVNLEEEDFRNISICINDDSTVMSLKLQSNEVIDFQNVSYSFYRSGKFTIGKAEFTLTEIPTNVLETYLDMEFETLTEFFYSKIQEKCIGFISNRPLNKLLQLEVAKKVGFKIPKTTISSDLEQIKLEHRTKTITKAIQENIIYQNESRIFLQYVNTLQIDKIDTLSFPSLFQDSIVKSRELRCFYFLGNIYTILINNTSADFRNSTNVAYSAVELPQKYRVKICRLVNALKLVSASVDFIIDESNSLVFLEANPQGEIDWLSYFGGYQLHKKIAHFLYEKETNF